MDNKFSKIKERVLQIAKYKKISYEKFCIEIGSTYGNFKGSNKNTPLNSDTIVNILSICPDINPEWLITGKGEMLKQLSQPHSKNIANAHGANNKIIQGGDVTINGSIKDIGNIGDVNGIGNVVSSHILKGKQTEKDKEYELRISEKDKMHNTAIYAKDELLKEKDERIKELKAQIEQLHSLLKLISGKT